MNQVEANYTNLKMYSEQIMPALDDYKKSYIYYNTNPDNEEYANIFSKNSGTITTLNKDVFVMTTNIEKNIDTLNKKTSVLDKKIKLEKKTNSDLVFKLEQLQGTNNGSKEMNSDSKELYKEQYISNWNMVIGIFLITGALITVFRKPIAMSTSAPKSG